MAISLMLVFCGLCEHLWGASPLLPGRGHPRLLGFPLNSQATSQFSIIINPLFETFNGMVSTTSLEELNQTTLAWVDQHCSLPVLRPSKWHFMWGGG